MKIDFIKNKYLYPKINDSYFFKNLCGLAPHSLTPTFTHILIGTVFWDVQNPYI